MNTYSITTTLPYVNADPHIGFALEIVQADMLARFYAQRGYRVIFNTGTDEHGQKIYKNAEVAGMDPKTYCDGFAAKFHGLKEALNLSYTHFIRTTDERHIAAAQAFWMKCLEAGDIYKKQYSVKYCVGCELEKTDSELVDGRCPIHPNRDLDFIEEENYFFRWSKYQDKLLALYKERPDFVVPRERLNEIRTFVEGGLNDFSISRLKTKMPWGIEVPNDHEHVMYVWFDALVNYISTLGWPAEGSEFASAWPSVQVAGKDNLRQQSAMWQAMLMSVGIEPSRQIFIHGYITAEGQKMSKSLGNVINPYDLVQEYGTDATRLYLLSLPSWQDGDFSREQFEIMFATRLANGIGNLVSRVAAMANKGFAAGLDRVEFEGSGRWSSDLEQALRAYDFKQYVDLVFSIVDKANEKIDREAPFKTVKVDPVAAKKTLSELAAMIRFIGDALAPVIPATAAEIARRYAHDVIEVGPALFPRRDTRSPGLAESGT